MKNKLWVILPSILLSAGLVFLILWKLVPFDLVQKKEE